jgi:hypothetical protein
MRQLWQSYRHTWHGRLLYSPRGVLAGVGILMGLGRLANYGSTAALIFGPSLLFGLALLTGGLALLLTLPIRLLVIGRSGASYAVFCFALMGAGAWGSTASILYLFCAALCIIEAITRRAYEC